MIGFITYRELIDGQLEYFILQKAFPHFVGRIVYAPVEGAIVNSPIPNYNLWVTFNGTLRGNMIPDYRNILDEIENAYANMAAWFWAERICMGEKRFQKFKIKK